MNNSPGITLDTLASLGVAPDDERKLVAFQSSSMSWSEEFKIQEGHATRERKNDSPPLLRGVGQLFSFLLGAFRAARTSKPSLEQIAAAFGKGQAQTAGAGPDGGRDSITATQYVEQIGPILKYKSSKFKAALIDDIRNIALPVERAQATAAILKYLKALKTEHIHSLCGDAIEFLEGEKPMNIAYNCEYAATEAIMRGEQFLNASQKARLDRIVGRKPHLESMLVGAATRITWEVRTA